MEHVASPGRPSAGWIIVNLVVLAVGLTLIGTAAFRLTHGDGLGDGVLAYRNARPCLPGASAAGDCYAIEVAKVTHRTERLASRRSSGSYVYWLDIVLPDGAHHISLPSCGCRLTSLHVGDRIPVYEWNGQITAVRVPSGHILSTDQSPLFQARGARGGDWARLVIGVLLCFVIAVPHGRRRYGRPAVRAA